MNDTELKQFLARCTATRYGFPVDELTVAHWREVIDPEETLVLSDALDALVIFDRESTDMLKPAIVLENVRRVRAQHRARAVDHLGIPWDERELARGPHVEAVGRAVAKGNDVQAATDDYWRRQRESWASRRAEWIARPANGTYEMGLTIDDLRSSRAHDYDRDHPQPGPVQEIASVK